MLIALHVIAVETGDIINIMGIIKKADITIFEYTFV